MLTHKRCNSTYRLRYWNRSSPTITMQPSVSVATVLTVYGIETLNITHQMILIRIRCNSTYRLRYWNLLLYIEAYTTYLVSCNSTYRLRYWNSVSSDALFITVLAVATVLTACGIETVLPPQLVKIRVAFQLQQYLPLMVYDKNSIIW